jgi:hypothetical protein
MMISQPALLCLEATWRRLTGRADALDPSLEAPALPALAFESADLPVAVEPTALVRDAHSAPLVPTFSPAPAPAIDPSAPLTAAESRARAAALRALAFSRQRQFGSAQTAFAEAARLDPLLDLTRTPDFWKLERAAHEAAIAAYLDAGRERDAAVLRARVQSTYRPKPLRPRPKPVFSP